MLKRPIPFHPFLVAAFPILFLYAHNIGALSPGVILRPLLISVALAGVLFGVCAFAFRDSEKAALATTLALLLFFSYGHATAAAVTAGMPADAEPAFFILWILLLCAGIFLIAKTRRDRTYLTTLGNFSALILVAISAAQICYFECTRPRPAHAAGSIRVPAGARADGRAHTPNIYYIVVDAYAGAGILKEVYGFDNSGFIRYLQDKGFYVAGASTSNYSRTNMSLASTLNMDYLDGLLGPVDRDTKDVTPVVRITQHNKVFDVLKSRGYTIAALSSGYSDSDITNADIYISPGRMPGDFENMLIGTTPVPLLLRLSGTRDQYDIHSDRILFEFGRLARIGPLREPFFVYAHLALPHPPFVFGPAGERRKPGLIFHVEDGSSLIRRGRLTRQQYIRGYIDQLTFTNRKLMETIEQMLAGARKETVIILQSDHGPRSMLVWDSPDTTNMRECMSILNAYYLPGAGGPALYDSITPVNTFRVVFDRYFGMDYGLLEDRNFFSNDTHPYRFIDVREKARGN